MVVNNQHYVSNFYLKGFANKKTQIYHFNKESMESRRWVTKNVGSQDYFYNINDSLRSLIPLPNGQVVESFFSDMENKFAPIYCNILEKIKKNVLPNLSERQALSTWIFLQKIRTPFFRKITLDYYKEKYGEPTTDKILEDHLGINGISQELLQIVFQEVLLDSSAMKDASAMIDTLAKRRNWMFVTNEAGKFATSDNPVAILPSRGPGQYAMIDRTIDIYFPLTREYLLIVSDGKKGVGFKRINSNQVKFANKVQILQSVSEIYSYDDIAGLAREMKRVYPYYFCRDRDNTHVELPK